MKDYDTPFPPSSSSEQGRMKRTILFFSFSVVGVRPVPFPRGGGELAISPLSNSRTMHGEVLFFSLSKCQGLVSLFSSFVIHAGRRSSFFSAKENEAFLLLSRE